MTKELLGFITGIFGDDHYAKLNNRFITEMTIQNNFYRTLERLDLA